MPNRVPMPHLAAPLRHMADELADLRAEIRRLSAREAVLAARLDTQPAETATTAAPARRGWPIQRVWHGRHAHH